jgi:hypothetical protein
MGDVCFGEWLHSIIQNIRQHFGWKEAVSGMIGLRDFQVFF